jgi:hypothetical protein
MLNDGLKFARPKKKGTMEELKGLIPYLKIPRNTAM